MHYALLDIETTDTSIHHGAGNGNETRKVQKRFVPADGGGDVYTEQLPSGRRRRFLLETVTITWKWRSDRPGIQRTIHATGRTILANGEISPRSHGFASFWSRQPAPDDLVALAEKYDPHLT